MKLSMTFLLNKMDIQIDKYSSSILPGNKYSCLLSYAKDVSVMPDTLYIAGPSDSVDLGTFPKESGCILFHEPSCPENRIQCEYIILKDGPEFQPFLHTILSVFQQTQQKIYNFMQMINDHASLQELTEYFYDVFGNPAYLVDANFKVLGIDRRQDMRSLSATWKQAEDYGYLSLDLVSRLVASEEWHKVESLEQSHIVDVEYFYTRFINSNIIYNGHIQGHLFIVEMLKTISPADIELADNFQVLLKKAMISDKQLQRKRGMIYECFMNDMFRGTPMERSSIKAQAKHLSIKKKAKFAVAKIMISDTNLAADRISSQIERFQDVRIVKYNDHIMCLFQVMKESYYDELKTFLGRLCPSWHCQIGLSDSFDSFYDISIFAKQAEAALALAANAADPTLHCFQDIALKHIISGDKNLQNVFCAPEIRRMYEYDQTHESFYCLTLKGYLENERSIVHTAQALNIHRNTLLYRIDRMTELFHLDLSHASIRLRYYLSLFILEQQHFDIT